MPETDIDTRSLVENNLGGHAYPSDLTRFVRERWEDCQWGVEDAKYGLTEPPESLVLEG